MPFKWYVCSTYRNQEQKVKWSLILSYSPVYENIDCDVWNYSKNTYNNSSWYSETEVQKVLNLDSQYNDIKRGDKIVMWSDTFSVVDYIWHPDHLGKIDNFEIFLKEITNGD